MSPRQDTEKCFAWLPHRQSLWPGESPAHPGWDTHHLLQLVLDLPVDFCHLEEHISCKDKMWGGELRCQALGDTMGWDRWHPSTMEGSIAAPQGCS